MSGRRDGPSRGRLMYALATLGLATVAAALAGGGERAWGIATAWVIQVAAMGPLDRALVAGRKATKPWLGGIALRAGGLIVTAGLAWSGAATPDLPIAYAIAVLVLLWGEAIRLTRGLRRAGEAGGRTDELDRERKTG
ncbi:hypothetical protein [Candidatus Palauibacter sp.]|uniref:hypothetical protein n=1 Tax=Candidatus Palauibacter sp. TaxID=3101350 RepID=UPI003B5259E1